MNPSTASATASPTASSARSTSLRKRHRALTTTLALAAAGLVLAPTTAFAAGGPGPGGPHGPGGPGGPHHSAPKPPSGPAQTVTRLSTGKALSAGKPVIIAARVSAAHRGAPGTPMPAETGTVVFTVDGTAGAPVPVAKNRATEKVQLAVGKHTVSAKYSGDGAHAPSDSGEVGITVA